MLDGVEQDQNVQLDVVMERTYVGVIEPDKEFERDSLVRGYRYGKNFVSFTKEDVNLSLKYKAPQTLTVIGFPLKSSIPRHYYMANTELLVACPGDEVAAKAIASLVRALLPEVAKKEDKTPLDSNERVALVRLVKQKSGGPPKLGCLVPMVKEGRYFGFWFQKLPFCEDIRHFEFPGLDRHHLTKPNVTPSTDQLNVMENFIKTLDLDHGGPDGEELLKPKETYNPTVLNLYEAIRCRASKVPMTVGNVIDPACVQLLPSVDGQPAITLEEARALPPAKGHIIESVLEPPKSVWGTPKAQDLVNEMKHSFTLEPVIKKGGNKRKNFDGKVMQLMGDGGIDLKSYRNVNNNNNNNGDNVGDVMDNNEPNKRGKKEQKLKLSLNQLLHGGSNVDEVGTLNPVQDFKAMIQRRDTDVVDVAIAQMQAVIKKLIEESVMNSFFGKAIDCMVALREGCVKEMEAEAWNTFLKHMRMEYQNHAFWPMVVQAKLTLIHDEESGESDVTKAEALAFLQGDGDFDMVEAEEVQQEENEEEDENLFEMMD